MQQPSDSPISRRLRTIRRRIAAAVLATFIAAWLAVAALGKGGATSTPAAGSAQPSTVAGQSDDGSQTPPDGFGGGPGDDDRFNSGSDQGYDDSGQSQSAPSDPVTTSQS